MPLLQRVCGVPPRERITRLLGRTLWVGNEVLLPAVLRWLEACPRPPAQRPRSEGEGRGGQRRKKRFS